MPLFKNRIPRNSVSFSSEPYELPSVVIQSNAEDEAALAKKSEHEMELGNAYAQLELEQQKLAEEKQYVEEMKQSISLEREQWEQTKSQYEREMNAEKTRMYYEVCDFLWEQSIEVAESIVHQAIEAERLSIIPILVGTIKQMPVSFEKLGVIVHPETVERLKEEREGTKTHWLIDNLEWKYDLSLQVGEFIIEEEKEFFEYRFQDIFQMLRQKLHERKYVEEESESDEAS